MFHFLFDFEDSNIGLFRIKKTDWYLLIVYKKWQDVNNAILSVPNFAL